MLNPSGFARCSESGGLGFSTAPSDPAGAARRDEGLAGTERSPSKAGSMPLVGAADVPLLILCQTGSGKKALAKATEPLFTG